MKSKKIQAITHDEWIIANFQQPKKPVNSFTIQDVMDKTGIGYDAARRRIKVMLNEGKITSGDYSENGKKYKYYLVV